MPFPSTDAGQLGSELAARGLTHAGIDQLIDGEGLAGLGDRWMIAAIIRKAPRYDVEVEHDETHWVGHDVIARPGDAGLTTRGVSECLAGLPLSSSADRVRLPATLQKLLHARPTTATRGRILRRS